MRYLRSGKRGQGGGKWKALILWALAETDCRRFGELRRKLTGISEKILAQQLG